MPSEGLRCLLVGSASGKGLHAVGLKGVSSGKSLGNIHEGEESSHDSFVEGSGAGIRA